MTAKEQFKEDFKNGWYILESVNDSRHARNIKLWAMTKDHEDGTRSTRFYFAYDVVCILKKECGAKVVKRDGVIYWGNDNPVKYKPAKGHKIEFII